MDGGTRNELLSFLAAGVASVTSVHPTRVAIDGAPGAGKTTLADELAVVLRAHGREVIRATIEGFLFPRAMRHRRGAYSAEGCYFDTHDYVALNRVLLDPLGPGGDRRFRRAVYDRTTDTAVSLPVTIAAADSVLLFDGVFLFRPELIDRWDLCVFVSTAFETTVDRASIREREVLSADEVHGVGAIATSRPNGSIPPRCDRPITRTSLCTTTICSSPHGRFAHADRTRLSTAGRRRGRSRRARASPGRA